VAETEVVDLEDSGTAEADLGMVACIADSIAVAHLQKAVAVGVDMAVDSLLVEELVAAS